MLKQFTTGRVAVFIDAANVFYAQRDLGWRISYGKLKKYFEHECAGSRVFMYTAIDVKNKEQVRFISGLRSDGFSVVTKPVKRIKESSGSVRLKGNVDVELSMGMLERSGDYDTAVLMSGDSDFAPVIDKIKSMGKKIIVMSVKKRVSIELLQRAKYINIDKLRDEVEFVGSRLSI